MNLNIQLRQSSFRIKTLLTLSFSISLFYMVFKPFQMAHYGLTDYLIVNVAYFLIILGVLTIALVGFPILSENRFNEILDKKYGLSIFAIAIIGLIGMAFFIFKISAGYYEFSIQRVFTGFLALLIFMLPIYLILKHAAINKKDVVDTLQLGTFQIKKSDLLYIQSSKNYIIWFFIFDNKVEHIRLRGTLKEATEKLIHLEIFTQSHRAFIVNSTRVKRKFKVENSHFLEILGTDERVPLGPTYLKRFN